VSDRRFLGVEKHERQRITDRRSISGLHGKQRASPPKRRQKPLDRGLTCECIGKGLSFSLKNRDGRHGLALDNPLRDPLPARVNI
jgi:hypothetical protein